MTEDTISQEHIDLHNTTYLMQRYNEVNGGVTPYALVHMNIKNFRYYNMKFGSKGGDEILRMVFDTLSNWLGEQEYAGHIYADNFGFLVKCDDVDKLAKERLMPLFDELYRIADDRIYRNLLFSMGVYQMTDSSIPFHDALVLANLCRKGSEGIYKRCHSIEIYGDKFTKRYMGHMDLEERTAEAYKNFEFVNFLQPKVDLKTETIVGAEVLLRWFDKDGKNIPINEFLPILDDNGYITLIDMDTFDNICKYFDERIKQGKKVVPISFNISKSHFSNPHMVKHYIDIFEKYDIPKELIQIELMESIAFGDSKRLKEVIAQFKEYGFACLLDDFGDGYSSFGVLLNAKLDIIKMDRQFFLENLNGDNELVIKTVVNLIHSLNMKVVAEGVENPEHIEWLKSCGCDYVQGYYYYKPMPIEEFDNLLD